MFLRLLLSIYLLVKVKHMQERNMGGERRPHIHLEGSSVWGSPRDTEQGLFVLMRWREGVRANRRCKESQYSVKDRGTSTVPDENREGAMQQPQVDRMSTQGPNWKKDAWYKNKPLSLFVWVTLDSTFLILLQFPW